MPISKSRLASSKTSARSSSSSTATISRQRELLFKQAELDEQERKSKRQDVGGNQVEGDESIEQLEEAYEAISQEADRVREEKLDDYQRMVSDTGTIPLQKLAFSPAGVALFDELCLRVDINQAYAECLPQWGDLAAALEVDELRTQWIRACVRPSEGLTRALLEAYMRDGGTLGEVLGALLKMEMLQTLEKIKPRVRAFLKEREIEGGVGGRGTTTTDKENRDVVDASFFSVLATLAKAFGNDDPCAAAMQKVVGGLRMQQQQQSMPTTLTAMHVTEITGGGFQPNDGKMGKGYFSPENKVFDPLKHSSSKWDKSKDADGDAVCRILLIYSRDGAATADEIAPRLQGMEHEGMRAEVFRLGESSLWYEVLTNPEACCMKWANEADYVMPVLTQDFLAEIHGRSSNDAAEGLLPTSPMLNRYMYTLLRARYAEAGCRNTMVRPVVPAALTGPVGSCQAVRVDPLLRLVWTTSEWSKLAGRARGMLAEVAKRRGI